MGFRSKLVGFLRLMRPPNCLMMGFAVLVGASVASGYFPYEKAPLLTYGFTTAFTLLAAANALNDYCDREIDAINEPGRPIPSGQVRPGEALALSVLLTAVGLISAYLSGLPCLLMAILAAAVADSYVVFGKRTGFPGNLMVSFCVAVPFLYGSLLAEGEMTDLASVFALIAFLANVGREVNKGIVDVVGDASKGIKTVAVSHGPRAAALVSSAFYLGAVVLSWLPPLMGWVSLAYYVPLIVITDLGFLWASSSLLRNTSRENARKVKNTVLLWMTTGMLGFILGSIL